jgi:hypothetical protein
MSRRGEENRTRANEDRRSRGAVKSRRWSDRHFQKERRRFDFVRLVMATIERAGAPSPVEWRPLIDAQSRTQLIDFTCAAGRGDA